MKREPKCIMLVDDNKIDNFFHERVIKKYDASIEIITQESAEEALGYLADKNCYENRIPDIIFLDVNMPGMDGWEFLDVYQDLDKSLQCKLIVVMLTTSQNPDEVERAKSNNILYGFKTKPLDNEILDKVFDEYYKLSKNL